MAEGRCQSFANVAHLNKWRALRDLGHIEGRNIVINYRYAQGETRTASRVGGAVGAPAA
jgi:hypothetical protein